MISSAMPHSTRRREQAPEPAAQTAGSGEHTADREADIRSITLRETWMISSEIFSGISLSMEPEEDSAVLTTGLPEEIFRRKAVM